MTDRYQCQVLRYTIVLLQVLPSLIFLAAQVMALRQTMNSIFGLEVDAVYPMLLLMTIILLFEWAGGLGSVAITDVIQGGVMLLSFFLLPIVLKRVDQYQHPLFPLFPSG